MGLICVAVRCTSAFRPMHSCSWSPSSHARPCNPHVWSQIEDLIDTVNPSSPAITLTSADHEIGSSFQKLTNGPSIAFH